MREFIVSCVGTVAPWAGDNLQLTLTHSLTHALPTDVAAAAEFAILLLNAVLEIVLLLLPEEFEHTGLSFKQREAWSV